MQVENKSSIDKQNIVHIEKVDGNVNFHGNVSLATNPKNEPNYTLDNLPQRNLSFTGRKEKLEELHSEFTREKTLTIQQTIAGLGGVGKTQLAIEYAHRYIEEYDKIVWFIVADDKDTTYKHFLGFCRKLGIVKADYTPTTRELQDLTHDWLQCNSGWLIILDNVENEGDIKPYLPGNYKGRVLITTRNKDFKYGKLLDLYVFSEDESLAFLKKHLNADVAQLTDLSERLGHYPLALKQAVAYISKCNKSVNEYLDMLESKGIKKVFERKPSVASDYKEIVTTTWDISFAKLTPPARQLFNLCAYLSADNIPVEIFLHSHKLTPPPLCEFLQDELDLDEIVAELHKYSLVEFSNGEISIHRLVQEVIREHLTDDISYLLSCLRIVKDYLPLEYHPSPKILKNFGLIAEHAKTTIEYGTKIITNKTDRKYVAGICYVMSERYRNMHEHAVALQWCEDSITLYKETDMSRSKEIAAAYSQAGILNAELNSLDLSLEMLEVSKSISIENNEPAETASTLVCIAYVHSKYNEPQKAIPILHEAREIFESPSNLKITDTAACYSNLGRAYKAAGELGNAEVWHCKALDIREKELGENTDTAFSQYSLAEVCFSLERYEEAYEYNTKSLIIRLQLFGDESPNTKPSLELAKKIHEKIGDGSFETWLDNIRVQNAC
jgi:tetratricopeptide (TPR) repeat protein